MPGQLPMNEKRARAQELICVSDEMKREYVARFDGRVCDVLFEREKDGRMLGRTGEDVEVSAKGMLSMHELVPCLLRLENGKMTGEPV